MTERDDRDPGRFGLCEGFVSVDDDRLARLDRDRGPFGGMDHLDRLGADGGDIEAHVLVRFGDFDEDPAAAAAEFTGPADAGVGPFDRLDRQDGAVFDGDALADVEPPHLFGDVPTEADVAIELGGAVFSGEPPFVGEQFGGEVGRRGHGHGMSLVHLGHRGQQGIVPRVALAAEQQRAEGSEALEVGGVSQPRRAAIEEVGLEKLARHRDFLDAEFAEVADMGTEPADTGPEDVVTEVFEVVIGMVGDGDADDRHLAGDERLGDEDRETTPAGDESDRPRKVAGDPSVAPSGMITAMHRMHPPLGRRSTEGDTARPFVFLFVGGLAVGGFGRFGDRFGRLAVVGGHRRGIGAVRGGVGLGVGALA